MSLATLVYLLCFGASLTCALLLLAAYARDRSSLLLWACLGFVGLTLNNLLLVIDLVVLPIGVDLWAVRQVSAAASIGIFLYGFLWKEGR
jgi:hypothetical protein